MADRSVKVRLEADVAGFVSKMKAAQASTQQFAKRFDDSISNNRESVNDVANTLTVGGAALTGFSLLAVKSAADFDAAMSSVGAATMAPQAEMDQLRQLALEMGADTKYSATEAAAGIEELAKAGVSTADIINGGLSGALNLAASDNIEVAEAAEIAATAMTQFGLSGKDVSHVADLLAAGAGKAQGGVRDLGFALQQSGLVASQFGLTVEETVGGLTAFASAGLKGSDAGTSFKTMLQRLANPSKEAQAVMDDLGITAYDAQGNFIGLAEFAGQLETAMKDLSPEARQAAMSVIFGSDAIRGANVLYSEGEAGIREWINAVNDQGYAAEMAAKRMDNLKGDVEQLGGAVETALINMGSGSQGALRDLVQTLTSVVDVFNSLPSGVQGSVAAIAGISGAALLAVGGLSKLAIHIKDSKDAFSELGLTAENAKKKLSNFSLGTVLKGGIAAGGIALLTTALGTYMDQAQQSEDRTEALAKSLDKLDGAATSETDSLLIERLQEAFQNDQVEYVDALGYSLSDMATAARDGGKAYDEMMKTISERISDLEAEKERMGDTFLPSSEDELANLQSAQSVLIGLNEEMQTAKAKQDEYNTAIEQMGGSSEEAAAAQQEMQAAIEETGVSLDGVIEDMAKYIEMLFQAGILTMDAREAEAAYQQSIGEVSSTIDEIIEKHGGLSGALNKTKTDFDLTTQSGRDANSAFQDVARDGMARIEAKAKEGAGLPELQADLKRTYDDLIKAAGAFGITGDSADSLAREVLGIPKDVKIDTWMSDRAKTTAEQIADKIRGIPRDIWIKTRFITEGKPPDPKNRLYNVASSYAVGGAVYGPGTGTSDSIPAWLSNGEHVLTAREVSAMGGHDAVYSLRKAVLSGNAPKFAGGGAVGSPFVGRIAPPRGGASSGPASVTYENTFNNWNSDAVAATQMQVAQFEQYIERQAVPLTAVA